MVNAISGKLERKVKNFSPLSPFGQIYSRRLRDPAVLRREHGSSQQIIPELPPLENHVPMQTIAAAATSSDGAQAFGQPHTPRTNTVTLFMYLILNTCYNIYMTYL